MSLARRNRDRILAAQTVNAADAPADGGGVAPAALLPAAGVANASLAERAAAQMKLRMTHDLRRLHDIQSLERKIDAKSEMLPEYAAWVEGLLASGQPAPGDEILPTIMIWLIDVGDFDGAMQLIVHVLRHRIPLPPRYNRTAPALIVEEIAEAALKAQAAGGWFDLALLEEIEALTADDDMHDEIRAKLAKAIGVELACRSGDSDIVAPDADALRDRAIVALSRAQGLNDKVGVKTLLGRLQKAKKKGEVLSSPPSNPETAGAVG